MSTWVRQKGVAMKGYPKKAKCTKTQPTIRLFPCKNAPIATQFGIRIFDFFRKKRKGCLQKIGEGNDVHFEFGYSCISSPPLGVSCSTRVFFVTF